MEKREYVFLAERIVSTFLAYRDKDFIESMYLTYKQEDYKSTSSTECEKGPVKSIGEIQYGC